MLALFVVYCLFTLALLSITLAIIFHILRELSKQLLERTLHSCDVPKVNEWGT
ncbi:hypothetical protein TRAPUB_11744 [Trametes pubescens]|uniref:Uncharacterized protein n=1 Tax=Trametes pubescens TaxID=154538 RepID=A0A1M2VVU9_TRAPU|nr:hypothetical protein TRAPUB_11744 [Trametes pubescens]